MTRLPRLKGRELIVFGQVTTVSVHSGEIIGPGLLRSILRDVEMSVEDLLVSR